MVDRGIRTRLKQAVTFRLFSNETLKLLHNRV